MEDKLSTKLLMLVGLCNGSSVSRASSLQSDHADSSDFTTGYVAFVVGGEINKKVELYSPDGNCQHKLAPLPFDHFYLREPVVGLIDEKIYVCGGIYNKDCWVYNVIDDSWSVASTGSYRHNNLPGLAYDKKIYIADDYHPEVFVPSTSSWHTWPAPDVQNGFGQCMLLWNDYFYLLGGYVYLRTVQRFNLSSQTWERMYAQNVPMEIYNSGCITLPTDEILVLGSAFSSDYSANLYNASTNTWTTLPDTEKPWFQPSLVMLGSRVFATDGDRFEEFNYNDNTWSPITATLMINRGGYQDVIAVPAQMFDHLPGGCVGVQ